MPKNKKGFSQWIEVFRAGTQTDSSGKTKTFTKKDLDSIVTNHSSDDPAPIVVGHPKDNSPAFGWTAQLRRTGDVLEAKFTDVVQEFADACKQRLYRKRSISIVPEGNGFKLRHVGFLGAAAPAVKGLKDIAFSADPAAIEFEGDTDTTLFEFTSPERAIGWGLSSLGRILRGMRDRIIESDGIEAADKQIPSYEIEALIDSANEIRNSRHDSPRNDYSANSPAPTSTKTISTNHPNKTEADMPKEFASDEERDAYIAKLEKENKAANNKLAASSFTAAVAQSKAIIDAKVKDGSLLPVQAIGLAEFMANLPNTESANFEFSQDETTTASKTPYAYFSELLASLKPQIKMGKQTDDAPNNSTTRQFSSQSGLPVDDERAALHKKALDYQKKNKGVEYIDAVYAVSEEA